MRIRFSEGTANIQGIIAELKCVEEYLLQTATKSNQNYHIKSADLYVRVCDEDDRQIKFGDKNQNIKALEFRTKPYKTAKNVELKAQTCISEDKTAYMYETNNGRWH